MEAIFVGVAPAPAALGGHVAPVLQELGRRLSAEAVIVGDEGEEREVPGESEWAEGGVAADVVGWVERCVENVFAVAFVVEGFWLGERVLQVVRSWDGVVEWVDELGLTLCRRSMGTGLLLVE